ncbi:MAG: DUF1194 domain-containing protein [Roseovarius sp.]
MPFGLPLQQILRPCIGVWCAVLALWCSASAPAAQQQLELHLLLAFDVSASVNDVEFDLQRAGTAAAFRSGAVTQAITDAPGGIAVSIIQWSSITQQALGLDWVHLSNTADALAYADQIDAMPRRLPGGGTMIHAGLAFAGRQLEGAPGQARRQVIDLSGNGQADDEDRLLKTRDRLLSQGVVINGLAIEEDLDDLTQYFYSYVIGGTGAFVITADDFDDFQKAMEIKLHREIAGPTLGSAKARRPG